MSEFGKRTDGVEGQRKAVRRTSAALANISTLSKTSVGRVVDISADGAKLAGIGTTGIGDTVLVKSETIVALADVVWVDGDCCGVRFDEPLTKTELAAFARESHIARVTRSSLDEAQAESDWQSGFAR